MCCRRRAVRVGVGRRVRQRRVRALVLGRRRLLDVARLQQLAAAWTTATLLRLRATGPAHRQRRHGHRADPDLATESAAVAGVGSTGVPARLAGARPPAAVRRAPRRPAHGNRLEVGGVAQW